jgi:hypothetical protein
MAFNQSCRWPDSTIASTAVCRSASICLTRASPSVGLGEEWLPEGAGCQEERRCAAHVADHPAVIASYR